MAVRARASAAVVERIADASGDASGGAGSAVTAGRRGDVGGGVTTSRFYATNGSMQLPVFDADAHAGGHLAPAAVSGVAAFAAVRREAVDQATWSDWRWQLRNRLTTASDLERYVDLTDDERAGIAAA